MGSCICGQACFCSLVLDVVNGGEEVNKQKKNTQSTDISVEDSLVQKKNVMLIFSQHLILITPRIYHQIN